jgi:endonuclease/exonuclease/phosphatase family metal-dependent hydrolase
MKRGVVIFLLLWAAAFSAPAQDGEFFITTLNCHAFFGGGETKMALGQPQTAPDYWRKAQNLVGLWPANAPLFVGLEEIGGAREVVYLSQLAAARYHHSFQPVFTDTKDKYTEEAVAAVVDLSQGWGIAGQPGRDPELDKALSKHLVVKLTNNFTSLEICVVHLRRPNGKYAKLQQQDQNKALKKWANDRLAKNPRANLVILGDFNESKFPGDAAASLAALVPPVGPLRDSFSVAGGRFRTHANGKAYDRILFSEPMMKGESGLKFLTVFVQPHTHGKGAEKYWFTDHFPVTAVFAPVAEK